MPIYTGGPVLRRGRALEETPTSLLDALSATAEEAWVRNPVPSVDRYFELNEARHGEVDLVKMPGVRGLVTQRKEPDSPLLSAEEARKLVEADGLDLKVPDSGIRADALDILMQRKRAEMQRRSILERAPTGFVPGMLKLGVGLGVSVADPVNIASAFVPVVGPSRYAQLLAKATGPLGRAGTRTAVGVAEGAVGASLVEPLVYSTAKAEQADYDLADSLMNVVFGSVLGGGLHAGVGAIGDALARGVPAQRAEPQGDLAERVASWSPTERQQIFDLAVKQMTSGRKVELTPIVELRDSVAQYRPASVADARRQVADSLRQEMREVLLPEAGAVRTRGEMKQLRAESRQIDFDLDQLEASFKERAKRLQREEKLTRKQAEAKARAEIEQERADLLARRGRIEDITREQEVAKAAEGDLSRLEQGIVPDRFKDRVEREAREFYDKNGQHRPIPRTVRDELTARPPESIERAWQRVRQQAERDDPRDMATGDVDLADSVTQRVRENPPEVDEPTAKAELDAEMERIRDLEQATDRQILDNLSEFDQRIEDADTLAKALRNTALCRLRSG